MEQKTKEAADERAEKQQEARVRRLAKRMGFCIEKLRGPVSNDNCGRYRLLDAKGYPHLGYRWDAYLDEIEANLLEKKGA